MPIYEFAPDRIQPLSKERLINDIGFAKIAA
jgi:hypothetical protein